MTEHFTLEEMLRSDTAARLGINNVPTDPQILRNLGRTCQLLEKVRQACGNRPVTVTSGYRSPELNTKIGSRPTSAHIQGCAADFRVQGLTTTEVMKICIDAKLPFDQLIQEFSSWVHIAVPINPNGTPRQQKLIIDGQGTREFLYR